MPNPFTDYDTAPPVCDCCHEVYPSPERWACYECKTEGLCEECAFAGRCCANKEG